LQGHGHPDRKDQLRLPLLSNARRRTTRLTSLSRTGGVTPINRGIRTDERHGFSFARAQSKVSSIFDVTLRVFQAADDEGVSPAVAADRLAEERIRAVGRLATIRLPH
jgi:hypothetical protein